MVQSQRLSATSGERMERGGFHGYQKTPNANSGTGGLKLSEINMRLSEMNHNGMGKNTNIVVNNNNNNHSMTSNGDDNECTVREQDRFMPIANVIRIMRRILPPHAKISDDAKETIQECVSEYISFITGEANERCQREQRKTITAEDVLWAMSKLGFDDYIEPLTLYLHRYREMEGDRGSIRSEPAANFMVKRAMGDHYGSGTFASFAPTAAFHLGHHHHQHGFFAIPNGAAAAASTSSSQASQQPAGAAVANGDHHAHAHAHAQFK